MKTRSLTKADRALYDAQIKPIDNLYRLLFECERRGEITLRHYNRFTMRLRRLKEARMERYGFYLTHTRVRRHVP